MAAYYGLQHGPLDATNKAVLCVRKEGGQTEWHVPALLVKDFYETSESQSASVNTGAEAGEVKIMKRQPDVAVALPVKSAAVLDAPPMSPNTLQSMSKRQQTREEKEEAYRVARERIFSSSPASNSTCSLSMPAILKDMLTSPSAAVSDSSSVSNSPSEVVLSETGPETEPQAMCVPPTSKAMESKAKLASQASQSSSRGAVKGQGRFRKGNVTKFSLEDLYNPTTVQSLPSDTAATINSTIQTFTNATLNSNGNGSSCLTSALGSLTLTSTSASSKPVDGPVVNEVIVFPHIIIVSPRQSMHFEALLSLLKSLLPPPPLSPPALHATPSDSLLVLHEDLIKMVPFQDNLYLLVFNHQRKAGLFLEVLKERGRKTVDCGFLEIVLPRDEYKSYTF